MKKNILILGVSLAAVVVLAGCEERIFIYEGKEIGESDLQEIIADKLEVENPDSDIEIDIYIEEDD